MLFRSDAAYTLAEYFGSLLLDLRMKGQHKTIDPVQIFVHEMNKNAKSLGMNKTNFVNPHGLKDFFNKSSALDITKLSVAAMKLPLFSKIVSTKYYECVGKDTAGIAKEYYWENTNKLLARGFNGIKTGITTTAGPCLVVNYNKDDINLIITVLCCKTPEDRWDEIIKMTNWGVERVQELNM